MTFKFLNYEISIDKVDSFTEFSINLNERQVKRFAKKILEWDYEKDEYGRILKIALVKRIRAKYGLSLKSAVDVMKAAQLWE